MRSINLLNILLLVAIPISMVGADDSTLSSTTSISTQTITRTVSQVVATSTVTSSTGPSSSASTTEPSSSSITSVRAYNTTYTSTTAYITSSVYSGVPMPSQNGTTIMSTGGQPVRPTTTSPPINNAATPALNKNVAIACLAGMLTLGVVFTGTM